MIQWQRLALDLVAVIELVSYRTQTIDFRPQVELVLQEFPVVHLICTVWLPLTWLTSHKHSFLPAKQENSFPHLVVAVTMCSSILMSVFINPFMSAIPCAITLFNIPGPPSLFYNLSLQCKYTYGAATSYKNQGIVPTAARKVPPQATNTIMFSS